MTHEASQNSKKNQKSIHPTVQRTVNVDKWTEQKIHLSETHGCPVQYCTLLSREYSLYNSLWILNNDTFLQHFLMSDDETSIVDKSMQKVVFQSVGSQNTDSWPKNIYV